MIKKYLGIICLSTLVFTSCSQDEVLNTEVETKPSPVEIFTQIESITSPDSRANIGVDGVGNFETNDQITLLFNGKNKNLTLSENGKWTPTLNWDEVGESASFVGFYPTVTFDKGSYFVHVVKTNQQSGNNFETSDLLCATTPEAVHKEEALNLNFKHLMSCLTVKLKSDNISQADLNSAVVKVRAYNEVQIYKDGHVGRTLDIDDKKDLPVITMHHKGNGVYQAVVCPYKHSTLSFGELSPWLQIVVAGKTFTLKTPPAKLNDGSSFASYQSGKNVTFTFKVNALNDDYANKTLWVDGMGNIPDLDNPAWKTIIGTNLKGLVWKSGDNWYDCDKLDPSTPSRNDHRLCWAATSSNLIHWWLDRNHDILGNYCSEKGIPYKYNDDHLNSDVFNEFKKSFTNEGGFINQGLNWFFLGKYKRESDSATNLSGKPGGYFKDVLSDVSTMCDVHGIVNINQFDEVLKDAFKKKQGIGFTIQLSGFDYGRHAMTIWGAKFDNRGLVSHIFYCDNNDGSDISDTGRLIAAKVKEDNGVRLQGSNKSEKYTIQILEVTLLNQQRNELKSYFK